MNVCMYDTLGPFWVGVEAATISYIFFLAQAYLLNEALLIIIVMKHA